MFVLSLLVRLQSLLRRLQLRRRCLLLQFRLQSLILRRQCWLLGLHQLHFLVQLRSPFLLLLHRYCHHSVSERLRLIV
jgi:hypothetical protein